MLSKAFVTLRTLENECHQYLLTRLKRVLRFGKGTIELLNEKYKEKIENWDEKRNNIIELIKENIGLGNSFVDSESDIFVFDLKQAMNKNPGDRININDYKIFAKNLLEDTKNYAIGLLDIINAKFYQKIRRKLFYYSDDKKIENYGIRKNLIPIVFKKKILE